MEQSVAEVEKVIASTPVLVFSKSYCPFCNEAKQLLASGDVEF